MAPRKSVGPRKSALESAIIIVPSPPTLLPVRRRPAKILPSASRKIPESWAELARAHIWHQNQISTPPPLIVATPHSAGASCLLPPATCNLQPAACLLPLATCHLPLFTCYLPLAISFLLPARRLPRRVCHSPQRLRRLSRPRYPRRALSRTRGRHRQRLRQRPSPI